MFRFRICCHLGTPEHFALFKMASKMAAELKKHPELNYYSTYSNDFGVKPYVCFLWVSLPD
jgi:hypothetical protein